VAGYSNIVVTSRELLRLEAEEIYELRQLTTDEGLSLFEQNYGGNLTNDAERLFVRSEIIEKLLDNNPLAIKLITSNIPKGKSFVALKHELEEDFFCKVSDAELATYDSLPDTNIERKKSLYASIDFSYRHLDEKEKKAFELLSLFPDGINIENLKRISNGKGLRRESKGQEQRKVDDFKITDPIIKALENKSMIQVDNNLLKLQSIVGKFSEKKLSDRKPAEIKRVQRAALVYNFEFCAALNSMYDTQHSRASRILHEHQNNFMKSFEFVDAPGFSKADLLVYMSDLNVLFNGISANGAFARAMARQSAFFSSEEDANLCFKSILLNSRYFDGQFFAAFDELRRILPLDQLKGLDFSKSTLYIAAGKAGELYSMEGFALDIMEVDLARGFRSPNYYPGLLFAIGEFSEKLAEKCYPNFFKFASLDAMGILSLEKLDEYMFGIYEKTHIERMQTHYLRCKHRPIAREVLEELVVVNPYTDGLKLLMRAFLEENEEQKTPYIVQAIEKLVHIKYFYVDALYYYAQNLKALGKTCEYKDVLERGKAIARDCGYRYLLYRFDILTGAKTGSYCVEEYALSEQVNLDAYLISLINTK
jgi:hypothetical protein